MITKIISGGQTGADMGGLEAAKALGLPTGGTAPKGFITELGSMKELLQSYGLVESPDEGYKSRTEANVFDSHATLILSTNCASAGTIQTFKFCEKHNRLWAIIDPDNLFSKANILKFLDTMEKRNCKVLNVAGNRESKSKGIQKLVKYQLLDAIVEHNKNQQEN